jgi:peroxiredoxin
VSTRRAGWVLVGLLAGATRPVPARAFSNVEVGEKVADAELRTLDGARHRLLGKGAKVNVLLFFRPEQEHSTDTLKDMAACEREFAGRPVHWVGIVSSAHEPAAIRAVVAETGIRMPVLIDEGDALYGRLGVRLHPAIGIVDGAGTLAAYEPFREINYCERVKARIRLVLGEIGPAEWDAVDHPASSVTRTDDGVARRHSNYARMLLKIGKHDQALAEVQQSLALMPTADAYAIQGQILAAKQKCPEALRAFEAALKIDPSHVVALEGKRGCAR